MPRLLAKGRPFEITALNVLTAAACLFFFAFATARALLVAFTYDEAATYLRYIPTDFLSVFTFDVATNHFLNTLSTKLFYLVGGNSELVLRMPNLIGYGMYMGFSLLILQRARHRFVAFAGFMLLNLNLYVLDFFALSRGYGLSLGLMMGSLFFVFRFLREAPHGPAASRDLSRALLFSCGAVLANFALLNVYLGVFGVALIGLVVFNAIDPRDPRLAREDARGSDRRAFTWVVLVAGAFILLVLSRDTRLSEKLYEPVEVRLAGLNQTELNVVEVSRLDVHGKPRGLPFDARTMVWRLDQPAQVTGLRIEMPVAAAEKLALIEAVVGGRAFSQRHDGRWTRRDDGDLRIFESGPAVTLRKSRMPGYRSIINWAGDARYAAYLIGYTAFALFVLGALALVLKAAGALAARANLLSADQWRPLASGALWLAALAGVPLYLLKRDSELYFGGTQGLVQETFYSVIGASFYDKTYFPAQTHIVFGGILATLAVFALVLYVTHRRRALSSMLPSACLLAIILIASLASVVQRLTLQTPYLQGRTALFYIPLYVLFVTFLCDAIAGLGRASGIMATSILVLGMSLSIYHFVTTANVASALEWRRDSSTKAMMNDLEQLVAKEQPGRPRVVLGVERVYSAGAAFYASKTTAADIVIVVLPSPSDFVYVDEKDPRPGLRVVMKYHVARSMLARTDAGR